MNAIKALMGEPDNSVRAVIISAQSAFTIDHVTKGVTAVTLKKDGRPYTPNNLGWVAFKDRDGVTHEDAEQNFTILLKSPIGMDGMQLSPSRSFPLEAIEDLATVEDGDIVYVKSQATGGLLSAEVIRGTPDGEWTIEVGFVPISGDSGSIVTKDGKFVGFVSASSAHGCLVSVPPILRTVPGTTHHQSPADPVPEPIAVPTNPTSPYIPPVGSSPEFKAGVLWERNRAFVSAQQKLDAEKAIALSAI